MPTTKGGWPIRSEARRQLLAKDPLGMSVTNIYPGAWVMQKSGRALAMTDWGVTPHAQNTGISPGAMSTASP